MNLDHDPRDTMRDMTPAELNAWYASRWCPNCRGFRSEFELGPRGGMSVNVACRRCDMRLNVVVEPYGNVRFGQVIREGKPL
jgi:hypothetical protein